MSCNLLARKLGMGFGHLGPFLGRLPRLLERGHTLHVAAREISGAAQALTNLPVTLYQAPSCMNACGGLQDPPPNCAEILMRYGYLGPTMLRGMMAAWNSLIRLADDAFRRNAAALAQRHAEAGVGTMAGRAVARIEMLASQGAGPSS